MSAAPDDTGFTADLQDKLTKISNSISASNRKFGGKGISCKASSTHPNNFGLGTLTLSKDFINDLRSNVATNYGYKIYPALPSNPVYFYELYNYPKTTQIMMSSWNFGLIKVKCIRSFVLYLNRGRLIILDFM